ncbi:hypothetical protein Tco_1468188 [Tanacetum coccineum]
MNAFDVDLGFIEQDATRVSDDVLALQGDWARDRDENKRLKRRLDELEVSNTLAAIEQDRIERKLYSMRAWVFGFMSEVMGRGAVEARPSESIDVLAVYGDAKRLEPQGPPDGSHTKEIEPTQKELEEHEKMTEEQEEMLEELEELEQEMLEELWFEKMESVFQISNGYLRKGQKQSKHDKTEHGNGKA